jgi:hypothetical protein
MQKTKKEKRLVLSRETLKTLREEDVKKAVGGFAETEEWTSCDCEG